MTTDSFTTEITIPASIDVVWELLTDPERLRRWQSISSRIDLRPGGAYEHLVSPGHRAAGQYTEVVEGKRLAYTWGWVGDEGVPPGSSSVAVELRPDGDATVVEITHTGLPDEASYAGHAEGWAHYYGRLADEAAGTTTIDPWGAGPEDLDVVTAMETAFGLATWTLRDVDEATMTAATGCADFDLAGLIDHVVGAMGAMAQIAGGQPDDGGVTPEDRLARAGAAAINAWRARGTDGEIDFFGRTAPATMPATIVLLELLLHGWDMSVATGRTFTPSPALVAFTTERGAPIIDGEGSRPERFGAVVDNGADAWASLLGWAGRTV